MLAELRQKAQITIPKEIIVKLGLSEGDKLDIFEKDGSICLMPVAVYPKKYLNELKEEINGVKMTALPFGIQFLHNAEDIFKRPEIQLSCLCDKFV